MSHRAKIITFAVRSVLLIAGVSILPTCENTLIDQIRAESNSAQFQADTVPPEIGGELIVGTVTQTSVALSWGEATDNVTPQGQLEYRVARAGNSGVLGSIESALQQTVTMNWTAATTVFLAEDLQPDVVYWFAVLVRDEAGNTSLYAAKESRTLNAAAPTPGDGPTFSNVQQTSVAVTWTVATDDDTPASLLEYKLVRASSSTAINTVSKADAITGAGLVMDWSTNTLSRTASGLSVYTTYHFAVLVRDSAHNMSIYSPQSVRTLGTQYTVTFNQQGGSTPSPASKPVHFGSPYGDLPTISRTGYQFGGWWTTASGAGTRIYSTTTVSTASNHQLHARWTASNYTVSFNGNGHTSGNTDSQTAPFDSTILLRSNGFSRTGYLFAGWATSQGGGVVYQDGASYTIGAANVTLWAVWVQAYWAQSVSAGSGSSVFNSVAVDSSGNVYAVGYQAGTGSYTYGNRTVSGASTGRNAVIVKFNSSGTAQWARSVAAGTGSSEFFSVGVDSTGNAYVAGSQTGNGTYRYGNVNVFGSAAGSYRNSVLVKYNTSGTAQWARSVSSGTRSSGFSGVAVDDTGNVFAVGSQAGNGQYAYGSHSITGSSALPYGNAVLVKYNSAGSEQWARTVQTATLDASGSSFASVATDSNGRIYTVGMQLFGHSYTYGTQSVAGTASLFDPVIVKYNTHGTVEWAKSLASGTGAGGFNGITVGPTGHIYAVGFQSGVGLYSYGPFATVAGTSHDANMVVVQYMPTGHANWARSVTAGSATTGLYAATTDDDGNLYVVGHQDGAGPMTYGSHTLVDLVEGKDNAIVLKFSSIGTTLWARSIDSGSDYSRFEGVAAYRTDRVLAVGAQRGSQEYVYSGRGAQGSSGGENVIIVSYLR